jgi:hypothetical protein
MCVSQSRIQQLPAGLCVRQSIKNPTTTSWTLWVSINHESDNHQLDFMGLSQSKDQWTPEGLYQSLSISWLTTTSTLRLAVNQETNNHLLSGMLSIQKIMRPCSKHQQDFMLLESVILLRTTVRAPDQDFTSFSQVRKFTTRPHCYPCQ